MAKPSNNSAYNADVKKLMQANKEQISVASRLDASYQQSRKPITPTMSSLRDAKKLDYRPGMSAGENWQKGSPNNG